MTGFASGGGACEPGYRERDIPAWPGEHRAMRLRASRKV